MRDPKDLMWAQACALLDKAERLQRQFFEPSKEGARTRVGNRQSIFSTTRELFIIAAMPGVPPEAVRIDMQGDVLVIVGHRPLPSKDRHANIVRLNSLRPIRAAHRASDQSLQSRRARAVQWLSGTHFCQARLSSKVTR